MEDEPGCKCQRNCWSIVVIILEAGAVLRKDKLTTLDLQNVVGFGWFFFWFLTIIIFFRENNFYVYTNIVCVYICLVWTHFIHIYVCTHTYIKLFMYTQICTCFPTCVGRRSDWNRDSTSTLNHSGSANPNPPPELWLNFTGMFPSHHRNSVL